MNKKLYFVKWMWDRLVKRIKGWDRWQWGWMVTCAWGPTAIMDRATNPTSFYAFGWFVVAFWICYALIYTQVKKLYQKYESEQNDLINMLKQDEVR